MAYGKTSVLVNQKIHSPELYYLENNINGLMSEDNLEDFIKKITLLINDTSILNKLNTNAKTYVTNNLTIENMANNFLNILK
jgi:glycosyltransferase involved in cell wall biosynthesis